MAQAAAESCARSGLYRNGRWKIGAEERHRFLAGHYDLFAGQIEGIEVVALGGNGAIVFVAQSIAEGQTAGDLEIVLRIECRAPVSVILGRIWIEPGDRGG